MRIISFIAFICANALITPNVRCKLNILKIQQCDPPVQETSWEDGEVPWLFRKKYRDGNETNVRIRSAPPPILPLSTTSVAFLFIE
jgi:hypothetical protein